jgi:ABC-type branched-subunit amino acid transport system permease subunit/pimeloyl-ACP methyl ester carboxylesterase
MKYAPAFQRTNGFMPVMLALLVLLVVPFVFTETYSRHMLILVFLYAIVASNWDLSLGFGGIVNFAHLAFFALGLYTYGILAKVVGIDPWIAILLGGVVAVAFAALLAIPILRLEGIYVILVTIAAAQLLSRIIISQSEYTGGSVGMVLLPRLTIGDFKLSGNGRIGYYYAALALLVASTVFLYKLERSSLGRAIKALHDNKYYAISRGVSEARIRLLTLCASAIFPGIAGGLYGAYVRVASPGVFGLGFLTLVLSIVLVGGIATMWGSLVAAFVIMLLSEALADYGAWRDIVTALLIIGVVVVYPGGIFAVTQELWGITNRIKTNAIARYRRHFQSARRAALTGTKDRLVQTKYAQVSVLDTGGDGQVVVLLHGNSSSKEAFYRQFRVLEKRFRVVSFDYPGHGVSPNGDTHTAYSVEVFAKILADLVEQLNLGEPVVFGWSLGGYVALEYAAQGHPIRALAISGTSPVTKYPDDMPRGYIASAHMDLAGKRFHSRREKQMYARHTVGTDASIDQLVRDAVWRTDGLAREQFFSRLKTLDWPRQARVLRQGRVPFAMLNGCGDPFINNAYCHAQDYGNIWEGRPHDFLQGGHAPFLDCADEFNAAFAGFIGWVLENADTGSDRPGAPD